MKKSFFILLIFYAASVAGKERELSVTYREAPPEYGIIVGACKCPKGQKPTVHTVTWTMATCKSLCTSYFGLCSFSGTLQCDGGTLVICNPGINCPVPEQSSRKMSASYTFYGNQTAKLIFKNAVPAGEEGNTVFEVESDTEVPLPAGTLVDGVSYQVFRILKGDYKIDYSDGAFGSVIVRVSLAR